MLHSRAHLYSLGTRETRERERKYILRYASVTSAVHPIGFNVKVLRLLKDTRSFFLISSALFLNA